MLRTAARHFFRVALYKAGVALEGYARRRAVRRVTGGIDVADFLINVVRSTEAMLKDIWKPQVAAATSSEHVVVAPAVAASAAVCAAKPRDYDNAIFWAVMGSVAVVKLWPLIKDWEVLPPGTIWIDQVPSYLARQQAQAKREAAVKPSSSE